MEQKRNEEKNKNKDQVPAQITNSQYSWLWQVKKATQGIKTGMLYEFLFLLQRAAAIQNSGDCKDFFSQSKARKKSQNKDSGRV